MVESGKKKEYETRYEMERKREEDDSVAIIPDDLCDEPCREYLRV